MSDLTCCPEWCDDSEKGGGAQHGSVCPESSLIMTKADFVTATQASAKAAIATYLWMLNEEGESHEGALEAALAEDEESAVCFAGIGSCGRGWCHHS